MILMDIQTILLASKLMLVETKLTLFQDNKERLLLFLFGIRELVKKFKELNLQKKLEQLLLAQYHQIKNIL